jgi:hypothetical protein
MDEQDFIVYIPVRATAAIRVRAAEGQAALAKGQAYLASLEEGSLVATGRARYEGLEADLDPDFPAWAEEAS